MREYVDCSRERQELAQSYFQSVTTSKHEMLTLCFLMFSQRRGRLNNIETWVLV